jgi:ferredoxin
MEAAVPANIFALIHAAQQEGGDVAVATAAASLCLGCGACTSACAVEAPVAERLRAWRAAHAVAMVAEGVEPDPGAGAPVRVGEDRRAFAGGRTARAVSGDAADVHAFAGVVVERLPAPKPSARFRTCFEAADVPAHPGQLACCGRREGFAEREPLAARAVAEANVEVFAGLRVACADASCAAWLRAHGGDIVGPLDATMEDS